MSRRRLWVSGAWATVLLVLLAMPTLQQALDFPIFNLVFLYFIFFWVTQATSWNIFSGYSGYFSFGQGAFYGAGLYVTANLCGRQGWPLLPALPVGAAVGGLIAVMTGVVVFRLRKLSGEIFALFTLAIALALGSLANNWQFIDGGRGIPLGTVEYPDWLGSTTEMLYYLGLLVAVVSVVVAARIQHSRVGFGLFSIRDDEQVAEGIGVPTFRYKLGVFTLNGALAGLSGALHAVQVNFISPGTAFGITIPLFVILMSVVGGRRHWAGPVLGAALIYTVTDRLTGLGLVEVSRILLALVLIASTLFLRTGIATRLLQRPVPALVAGGVAMAVQSLISDQRVVTKAAIAMVVVLLVLFIPDRLLNAVPGMRRAAAGEVQPPPETADLRAAEAPAPPVGGGDKA